MMQLHPAHSNPYLHKALKTTTAKTLSPNLNCTHRNLGQNPTLFLFRLQHAHSAADSKSQVLTAFQQHPTFPPQFFIPLAHSLPTHFLCITLQTSIRHLVQGEILIFHSSALLTLLCSRQRALIK